ncbi:hypothetical protein F5Y17DRAFT_321708 [Xylariaceae sp. FL0594]|nr:hypothetical protein F5Y17DRAFT_321708 [Xylariaceae sp. FL0594]
MANLTEDELSKLFSGAPQFFARSQGHGSGAPHPSVAFPLDEGLAIRDLTDHTQIEHDAWGCVTNVARLIQRDPSSALSPTSRTRPHFNLRCWERPSMLSMQGLEKGTMGYQAALELAVSDSLQEEQYGFDSLGSKSAVIVEQRQRLITSKDTLRHMDDACIMEQLSKVEKRYNSGPSFWSTDSRELYDDLFQKVLYPPTSGVDPGGSDSLAVQIYALVKTLAVSNAWIDFSRLEWRLRLGQILWGFPLDDEVSDGSSISDGADAQDRAEERYWLLLQILLACELLTRLDAITEGQELTTHFINPSDVHRFEREANASVRWSLILARSWLENITISKSNSAAEPAGRRNWLSALTSKMVLKHEHMHGAHYTDHTQHRQSTGSEDKYIIRGRYSERQLSGLLQFAQNLRWPGFEFSKAILSEKATALSEGSPVNVPPPANNTQRPSYFGKNRRSVDDRKQLVRRRKVEAALHPAGWLSRSYMSGLILPGDTLAHSLMSTLLEVDDDALVRLGPIANMSGGFIYKGKSFWSTACVVGRVMAAGRGASECMGWVSSDVIPQGRGDGWLDVAVEDIHDDVTRTGRKARLWGKITIERESNILGDTDPSDVFPADFIIPHESAYSSRPPSNIRVRLESLDLQEGSCGAGTGLPLDNRSSVYTASTTFTMTHDSSDQEIQLSVSLATDVYFVTAHPCAASSHVKYLKSPSSPTIRQIDIGGRDFLDHPSSPAHITGHPLHRSFTYSAIHLTDLLGRPASTTLDDLLKGPATHEAAGSTSPRTSHLSAPERVLVIDCITGFAPPESPESSEQLSSLSRISSLSSSFALEPKSSPADQLSSSPVRERRPSTAHSGSKRFERVNPPSLSTPELKMQLPTRRRQFGSDLEILVRAYCASKGWNAIVSRRRRACLACAIREAGALGWRVVIRVD